MFRSRRAVTPADTAWLRRSCSSYYAASTSFGHEICDSGSRLHSVDILSISSSYHPTSSGQILGYQPVFSRNAG
jgi:hypothetical protein